MCPYEKCLETRINKSAETNKSENLFNDPRINKSAHTKKSGNQFNDPRTNMTIQKVWKLIQ